MTTTTDTVATTSFIFELLNYLQVDRPAGSYCLPCQTRLFSFHRISVNFFSPVICVYLLMKMVSEREKEL